MSPLPEGLRRPYLGSSKSATGLPRESACRDTEAAQQAHLTYRTRGDDETSVISRSVISTSKQRDGKKKINQYIVMKEIGKGSFGKVKLVLNTEEANKPYAMKVLSKSKLSRIFVGKKRTAMENVMQEIAIMKKLVRSFRYDCLQDHENVVRLYEVLDDPSVDKLYIIMEYVKAGSLLSKQAKTPGQLWKYFRDVLSGLHYCKSLDAHRG